MVHRPRYRMGRHDSLYLLGLCLLIVSHTKLQNADKEQLLNVIRMVTFQLALNATRLVDPNNLAQIVPTATFWALFTDAWAFLSVTLPKIAVGILLIRIFRPRAWLKATIMSTVLGLFAVCIGGFIICFVQCNPVAGQWNPYKYPKTKCWPRNVQIKYALVGSCKFCCT
jgi:hypothetical protein